jgi:prevent-host-death family protein
MPKEELATKTLSIAEFQTEILPLARAVAQREARVIVEDAGTPLAVLVSIDDLERWTRLDRAREERFAVLDRMRAAFADVPEEELEREVAKVVAEVRAEMNAERQKRAMAS